MVNKISENSEKTKVLIAHKAEDRNNATSLKDLLLVYAFDRLTFDYLEENSNKGGWEIDLQHKIYETDLLIFFISNGDVTRDDWDWFIWAAGAAWQFANEKKFPIMMIYSLGLYPPLPLRLKVQSFCAETNDLIEFLEYFFSSPDFTQDKKALNSKLAVQMTRLTSIADEISSQFIQPRPYPIKRDSIPLFIMLVINNPDEIINASLDEKSPVESNNESLSLFGLRYSARDIGKWQWKDILEYMNGIGNLTWVNELEDAIFRSNQGFIIDPIKSTFRAANGKIYRPVLQGVEQWSDNSKRFMIFFTEQVSEGWVANAPNLQLATLLTGLNLGARLQWEVCDFYLQKIERGIDKDNKEELLQQVKEAYRNLEIDAEIRSQGEAQGQRNQDRMRDSFRTDQDRKEIDINLSEQTKYKKILLDADKGEHSVNQIKNALLKLSELNKVVILKAAHRYTELLRDWAET